MSYPRNRFEKHGARFGARRVFVDRDRYLKGFLVTINQVHTAGKVVVWNVYGDPGLGKSRLATELYNLALNLRSKQIAACRVDFAVPPLRRVEDALYSIRAQLPFHCDSFDFAFARYWALLGRSMTALADKRRSREGGVLVDVAEYAKDAGTVIAEYGGFVPGLGLLLKLKGALGRRLRGWRRRHKDLVAEVAQLSPSDLRDRLAYYLGVDIRDAAHGKKWTTVFILDSFEKLTDPTEHSAAYSSDQWVRDLLSTSRRTFAVICSTRVLRWQDHESEAWGHSFTPWLLDGLDRADVDAFLTRVPIPDSALRAHITDICGGSPFLIDLCLDTYERLVESGSTPSPSDIGIDSERIIDRFLAGCSVQEKETLEALAFPDVFDEELFRALVSGLSTGYPAGAFDRIRGFSFVRRLEGTSLFHLQHDLRQALLLTLSGSKRARLTSVLLKYCQAAPIEPETDSLSVVLTVGFQLLSFSSDVASWLYGTARDLTGAGYWPTVDRLLSEFSDCHGGGAPRVIPLIRSLVLRRWGQINDAIAAHEEGDPEAISYHKGFAELHYANLVRMTGDYDKAEGLYHQVAASNSAGTYAGVIARKQLADILMLRGNFRHSLESLDDLMLERLTGPLRAEVLRQKGHVLRWNFMFDSAAAAYQEALQIAATDGLPSLVGRLEANLLELGVWCRKDPGDLVDRALQTNERLGAVVEIGKVHCARATHYTLQTGELTMAREELASALRCFRRANYRAGFAFALVSRVLLDLFEEPARAGRTLKRLVALTDSLRVYGFLAEGLHGTGSIAAGVRPTGHVCWLDRARAQEFWKSLVDSAQQQHAADGAARRR